LHPPPSSISTKPRTAHTTKRMAEQQTNRFALTVNSQSKDNHNRIHTHKTQANPQQSHRPPSQQQNPPVHRPPRSRHTDRDTHKSPESDPRSIPYALQPPPHSHVPTDIYGQSLTASKASLTPHRRSLANMRRDMYKGRVSPFSYASCTHGHRGIPSGEAGSVDPCACHAPIFMHVYPSLRFDTRRTYELSSSAYAPHTPFLSMYLSPYIQVPACMKMDINKYTASPDANRILPPTQSPT